MSQRLVESKSIQEAALYKQLEPRFRVYAIPYSTVYIAWAYAYLFAYDKYLGSAEFNTLVLGSLITIHALLFLSCKWSVKARTTLTALSVKDPRDADIIRLIPKPGMGKGSICPIIRRSPVETVFLLHQKKYTWNPDRKIFIKQTQPGDHPIPFAELNAAKGLTTPEAVEDALDQYGPNRFEIPFPTFRELFEEHAVAPFFVFQLFCVALWCLDEYWYYSIFTLVMLVVFESTVVMQRIKTLQEFRTLSLKPFPIRVLRCGEWSEIQSDTLLPGDVCSVVRSKGESAIPCDMVLLEGSCIANEAMLSGESTPQSKESVHLRVPSELLDTGDGDRIHILFGGTKVLQVSPVPADTAHIHTPDGGCAALVLRTGFGTSQGKLVRTMVYNTEHVSANNTEALMFILFLLIFAIAASAYVWIEGNRRHGDRRRGKLMLDCVMILTSVVPPELPMELSLAVNTSLIALSKYAIFCTEPFRIPFAGKVDVCCFDKTGTLTGEDLVVEGVTGITLAAGKPGKDEEETDQEQAMKLRDAKATTLETILVLATAQALVRLEEEDVGDEEAVDGANTTDAPANGKKKKEKGGAVVVGDPMEKAALDAIGWSVGLGGKVIPIPPTAKGGFHGWKGPSGVQIHRRFPFSSSLKRMSTVGHIDGAPRSETWVAVKGAPETLKHMYRPASIPPTYDAVYRHYGRRGSRVLALGWKRMRDAGSVDLLSRDQVESDLEFAGFLIFHCPLKPDTKDAVRMLNESSHRVVMITGDNALTACHVAEEVEIVTRPVLILGLGQEEGEEREEEDGSFAPGADTDADADAPDQDKVILRWRRIEEPGPDDDLDGLVDETGFAIRASDLRNPNGPLARLISPSSPAKGVFSGNWDLCLTGGALAVVEEEALRQTSTSVTTTATATTLPSTPGSASVAASFLRHLVSNVWVYARVSPRQKEIILTELKAAGYITLMCGDGTNDVGALKQAHVGVALLDGKPEDLARIAEHARIQRLRMVYEKQRELLAKWDRPCPPPHPDIAHFYTGDAAKAVTAGTTNTNTTTSAVGSGPNGELTARERQQQQAQRMTDTLMSTLGSLEDGQEDEVPVIKLGDASVAAPFTSKLSSIMSICNIVRQGRCTLVATIQMYKILALNCLISAFSLSVLYLDGIKYGDFQMTVSGLLLAVCFMCISKATPLEKLSKERPQNRIFCPYILLSILGQFFVHIAALVLVVSKANAYAPPDKEIDVDGLFEPNLLNTSVYLISLAMQVSTFAINYQGAPFRESLQDNKVLFNGLRIVGGIALAGATELFPDLNAYMQLVPFPDGFSLIMTAAVVGDFAIAYLVEAVAYRLFADDQPKSIVLKGR